MSYTECADALIIPALVYAFITSAVSIYLPGLFLPYIPAAAVLFLTMMVMLELNKAPGDFGVQILQLFASVCIYTAFRGVWEALVLTLPLPSESLTANPIPRVIASMPLFGGGYTAVFCILASGGPLTNRVYMLVRKACRDASVAGMGIMLAGCLIAIIYYCSTKTSGFEFFEEIRYYNYLNPAQVTGGLGGMLMMLASIWGITAIIHDEDND